MFSQIPVELVVLSVLVSGLLTSLSVMVLALGLFTFISMGLRPPGLSKDIPLHLCSYMLFLKAAET